MSSQLPSSNSTAYLGVKSLNPPAIWYRDKAPDNTKDVHNYTIGDEWLWTDAGKAWKLMSVTNQPGGAKLANWVSITGGGSSPGIQALLCDNGVSVPPAVGIVTLEGTSAQGVSTSGNLNGTATVNVQNADTAGNKGVATFDSQYFSVTNGLVDPRIADTGGTVGVSTYSNSFFNVSAGLVTPTLATTGATQGVANFSPEQFNASGGTISLTGSNSDLPVFSYSASPQSNVTGSGNRYTIVFANRIIDQLVNFDGISTFTAPTTGVYLLGCTLAIAATPFVVGNNILDLYLVTSSNTYTLDTCNVYNTSANANFYKSSNSQLVAMNATDTAKIQIFISGLANTVSIENIYCTFWGYQVA